MNFIDTRLKIRRFIKRNRKKVIFIVITVAIIIAINYILKNMPETPVPKTTYQPNVAVMDESEVPEKWHSEIENRIATFVDYCNNKEYENAYNMISDDCKSVLYPVIGDFKEYVDKRFQVKRIYSIQNFSNISKQYIYDVNFMSDFMATGSTGTNYGYVQEKFVFTEDDNSLKFAIGGFIRSNTLDSFVEDENLKIVVKSKNVFYDHETYSVDITNKTDYPIVLGNGTGEDEIALSVNDQLREEMNIKAVNVVLQPNESKSFTFIFEKYCDDGNAPQAMYFTDVRVLHSYTGTEETRQEELDNAVRRYSLILNFNVED